MSRKTKIAISVLLCSVILIGASFPVNALTDHYDQIHYGLGVRIICNGSCNAAQHKAIASIQLSFVNGVGHLPESDYSCRIDLRVKYSTPYGEFDTTYSPGVVNAMASGVGFEHSSAIIDECEYWTKANSYSIHHAILY